MRRTTIFSLIVCAIISTNVNAQSYGEWNNHPSPSGTKSGVAAYTDGSIEADGKISIGAGAIASSLNSRGHIHYCDPNEYGLIITKGFCGYPNVIAAPVTYDGVVDVWDGSGELPPTIFTSPINFFLTGYSSYAEKPILWLRQEQASGVSTSSGTHNSRMIVTPYGKSGFNIENPRVSLGLILKIQGQLWILRV